MKKSLLVLYVTPGKRWLHILSQGLIGLTALFISLLLLLQFYQLTLPKLVAWLLPAVGLVFVLNALWRTEQWRCRQGVLLLGFQPQAGQGRLCLFWQLVPAFWFLAWLLLWREIGWIGTWQYVSGELLIRSVSAIRAPAGYYELGSGNWLGSTVGDGGPAPD